MVVVLAQRGLEGAFLQLRQLRGLWRARNDRPKHRRALLRATTRLIEGFIRHTKFSVANYQKRLLSNYREGEL